MVPWSELFDGWISQNSDGRGCPAVILATKVDGGPALFVGIHELPQSSPRFSPHPLCGFYRPVVTNRGLHALYSAGAALVVPSRQEAFGQTASEAQVCGTPAVSLNIGGLPDIVEHQRTGYLAKAFETEDLAAETRWVLGHGSPRFLRNLSMTGENSAARDSDAMSVDIRKQSREPVVARFSNEAVAERYRAVNGSLLKTNLN